MLYYGYPQNEITAEKLFTFVEFSSKPTVNL